MKPNVLPSTLITLIFTFDQLSLDSTTKKQVPSSSAVKSARLQSVPPEAVVDPPVVDPPVVDPAVVV